MHVSHSLRFLAVFGALSMFATAIPVHAQYYYNSVRTPRQWRNYYRNRSIGVVPYGAVANRSHLLGTINNAAARGLISPQEADSLVQQYYGSIANDARDGSIAHMNNFEFVLNNLINLRQASLPGR